MKAIIVLLFTGLVGAVAAQVIQAPPPAPVTEPGPAGDLFAGTWSVAGQRQSLQTGARRRAVTVQLSGAVAITTGAGLSRGFRGEVIGFDDGAGLVAGRAVWTDENGDRIFSAFTGDALASSDRQIRGTITGGTGRYADVAGEYQFRWQSLVETEGNLVNGRAVDLRGRVRGGSRRQ